MDTEIPFVEKIRNRMKRIEATLTDDLRLKYQKDIDLIYRLLDLFEDTGGVSKEIKKKLDEATEKISSVIKGKELLGTKGLSPVKPNIDSLDLSTMNKAKMVNASNVFLESNNNEDVTNESLRGTKFKIDKDLSTDEGLVLTDDEGNVKISFRGTNTSFKRPIQSIKDLVADTKFITGTEQYGREGGELESGRKLIQSAIDKYGRENVNEILGHSLGGQKSILLGDEFNIKTTTFNPLIGYNSIKSSTTATPHDIFRTTEDITSLGAGFATEKKNWNVKSILPKKISLDPRQAHKLNNFFDNEGRATESPLERKVAKVVKAGKRKAQVEDFNDTFDLLSGIDDIPGIDQKVMEQRLQMNYPSSSELLDESIFQEPTPQPDELIDTSDLERRMSNLIQDKPIREQVFNPDDFKNKNARQMANMRKGRFETFSIEGGDNIQRKETLPMKQVKGKASDIDLGIFEPTEEEKSIKDIDFDDITDFFRNNTTDKPNKINDFELSSLNDDEIDKLISGTDKDRNAFEEITNNDFNDSIADLDNHFKTLSTENLEAGGFGSDLVRALSPTNLMGGLVGGVISSEAIDFVDPDRKIQKQVREGLIGSGAGLITSLASSSLGAGGGVAALGPEALAGGLGYLAGEETTEGVAKLTGSRAAGDVTGGLVGGGVGGLTLAAGTALATDVATGTAIGTAFDPVTAGLGTAIGAGVGAAIGGISYGLHKLFS